MKRIVLLSAIVGMAALVAAPALAERGTRDGEGPKAEYSGRGSGGPGQGARGTNHGLPRPGGPGGPQGGPSRFIERMLEPEVAQALKLQPEQVKTLRKAIKKTKRQEEALRKRLEAAGKKQAELLSAEGDVDEEAVMKAIEKTGKIRTQMAKLRIQPVLLVKKTLTEEQLEKAHKMMRARMKARRGEWEKRRGQKKVHGQEFGARRGKRQKDCDSDADAVAKQKDEDESQDKE